jgi:hypothetical protein
MAPYPGNAFVGPSVVDEVIGVEVGADVGGAVEEVGASVVVSEGVAVVA